MLEVFLLNAEIIFKKNLSNFFNSVCVFEFATDVGYTCDGDLMSLTSSLLHRFRC